jgi:hypothetical protein
MGCGKARKKFIAYLENSLSEKERSEVEAHLRSCPECEAELSDLSRLGRALRAAAPAPAEPPPGFASGIASSLRAPARAQEGLWWRRARSPLMAAAGVAAVAGLIIVAFSVNWRGAVPPSSLTAKSAPPAAASVRASDETRPEPGSSPQAPVKTASEARPSRSAAPSIVSSAGPPRETVARLPEHPREVAAEPAPTISASARGLAPPSGAGGGSAGGGPGLAAAGATGEAPEAAPRPVSVAAYSSDDEGSRLEEAMALFAY